MSSNGKGQSLADLLLEAVSENKVCRLKALLGALTVEERKALDVALRSKVATSKVTRILEAGGHRINRIVLAEKRKCYTESESCSCRTPTK